MRAVSVVCEGAALPTCAVHIKGVEVKALFDTGATRSFLHPLWLSKLDLTGEQAATPLNVTCANGTSMWVKTQCLHVPIRIAVWEGKADLLVGETGQPLLIGYDCIRKAGPVWKVQTGELRFPDGKEHPSSARHPSGTAPKAPAVVSESHLQLLTCGGRDGCNRGERRKPLNEKKPLKAKLAEEVEQLGCRQSSKCQDRTKYQETMVRGSEGKATNSLSG